MAKLNFYDFMDLNQLLMQAVSDVNYSQAEELINRGADVNYRISEKDFVYDNYEIQPTSPLKMVVFRISDSFLSEADLDEFFKIVKILIFHGAEKVEARKMAQVRYGNWVNSSETGVFMNILRLLD